MIKRTGMILMAFVVCFCASAATLAKSPDNAEPKKTISTDGSAKIWITPDRARLFLGVETQDETIEGARQKNAATMNRIMKQLKALEIKDLLSQSPSYNVTIVKEEEHIARKEQRLPEIIGYRVTQRFTVLIKDKDIASLSTNAGRVLDSALQNGVNIIDQNILFFKEDITQDKKAVLKLALKDAMARADLIAETAGMTIKDYSAIRSGFSFGSRRPSYSQNMQQIDTGSSEGTASTIMAAKIPVEASVSLTCSMK